MLYRGRVEYVLERGFEPEVSSVAVNARRVKIVAVQQRKGWLSANLIVQSN